MPDANPDPMPDPGSSFADLMEGYHAFRREDWERHRDSWHELAKGQHPRIMVIACSDSRVDPATVFNTLPGEIFVLRNIANLVPPDDQSNRLNGVSAALEYAVTQLEVSDIVVMGHHECGGAAAALAHRFDHAGPGEGGYIDHWLHLVAQTRDAVVAEHGALATVELEQALVCLSLANLRSFPWIARREAAGTLCLHGVWFSIADGRIHTLDTATNRFLPR
jgi:carbonic anhydrase